jgi:hypothetical protein
MGAGKAPFEFGSLQLAVEICPYLQYLGLSLCKFYSDTDSKSLATLQILLKKLLSIRAVSSGIFLRQPFWEQKLLNKRSASK